MSLLKQLFRLFNPSERWQLIVILALTLAGAVLETISVGAIPAFVALLSKPDLIKSQSQLTELYLFSRAQTETDFLFWLGFTLLVVFCFKNIYLGILAKCQYQFLRHKQVSLASHLLDLYLHAPYPFHLQRNSAEISLTLTSEMHKLFWNVLVPLMMLAIEVTVTTLLVILLIVVEPISSLFAVAFLGGVIAVFNMLARRIIRSQGQVRQIHDGQLYQWVNQGLGGIKETKILGKENFFVNKFSYHKTFSERANVTLELVRQFGQLLIETVVVAAVLMIVMITLAQGRGLESVLPTLSLFAIAALRIMPSAKRIASTTASIRYYKNVVDLIANDIINLETAQSNSGTANKQAITYERAITLDQVSYQYPGTELPTIQNASLVIPKSTSVAFVGASGAGKSTLVDIILGLLTPTSGKVQVDGQDIHDDLPSWQRQVGYIPQTIYLSDDTIRRNIAFGLADETIDDNQVWKALKAAQLDELVDRFPNRLDTLVGEQGVRLSGGQRQRVGIARALYYEPKILIMDEATAALDNATEYEFMKALDRLSGDKTLVMIAHRLSTVKNCDHIYFIEQGKVVDSGSYDRLVNENKAFQNMANSTHE